MSKVSAETKHKTWNDWAVIEKKGKWADNGTILDRTCVMERDKLERCARKWAHALLFHRDRGKATMNKGNPLCYQNEYQEPSHERGKRWES